MSEPRGDDAPKVPKVASRCRVEVEDVDHGLSERLNLAAFFFRRTAAAKPHFCLKYEATLRITREADRARREGQERSVPCLLA